MLQVGRNPSHLKLRAVYSASRKSPPRSAHAGGFSPALPLDRNVISLKLWFQPGIDKLLFVFSAPSVQKLYRLEIIQ